MNLSTSHLFLQNETNLVAENMASMTSSQDLNQCTCFSELLLCQTLIKSAFLHMCFSFKNVFMKFDLDPAIHPEATRHEHIRTGTNLSLSVYVFITIIVLSKVHICQCIATIARSLVLHITFVIIGIHSPFKISKPRNYKPA